MDKRKTIILGSIVLGVILLMVALILIFNAGNKSPEWSFENMVEFYDDLSNEFKNPEWLEIKGVVENVNVFIGEDNSLKAILYGQIPANYNNVPELRIKNRNKKYFLEVYYRKDQIDLQKGSLQLDLYIPEDYQGWFSIDTYSGSVQLAAGKNSDITVNSVSGDITAEKMECNNFVAQSVSGDVVLTDIICFGILDARSTSGNVSMQKIDTKNMQSASVSGNLSFVGNAGQVTVETVSGPVDIRLESLKDDVVLTGVSGDISLLINASAAFDLNADTTTGNITLQGFDIKAGKESPGTLQGKINGGGYDVKIRTTSGSITIDRNSKS